MNQKVSIIIPCKEIDSLTIESINKCKELDYDYFEIIVLPDIESLLLPGIKIISTGAVSPGRKRNIGVARSDGEFLAFIDNDAYPRKDWLKNAMKYFENPEIAGVGGPGVTPDEDPLLQKALIVVVGDKADLKTLPLARRGEPQFFGDGTDLGLGQFSEREECVTQRIL